MDTFYLGIIGRCLALQPGIPLSDLYHKRLKMLLQERDGVTLRVSLAGRSDLEPCERMRALYKKKPLNGVLYHMRHAPEQLLFNSRRNSAGKLRYSLNPSFFKRFLLKRQPVYEDGDAIAVVQAMRKNKSKDHFDTPPQYVPWRKFLGISLRQVNLWAGNLFGLNIFAIRNEWFFVERLRDLCLELNIPLFVLGPIPSAEMLESPKRGLVCERQCRFAETELSRYGIPYCFLHPLQDKESILLHKRDGYHLTSEGHAFLASKLYPEISSWIRSVLDDVPKQFGKSKFRRTQKHRIADEA